MAYIRRGADLMSALCHQILTAQARPAFAFAQVATATANNTNSPNFGSLSIGAAHQHRTVLLALGYNDTSVGAANLTDVVISVNGVPTPYVLWSATGSSDTRAVALGSILVPLGTTATITAAATFTGTMDSWALAVFRAVSLNSIYPVADKIGSDDLTINTAGGRFVLLASADNSLAPGSYTGGGSPTLSISNGFSGAGYDASPTGASTVYSAANDTDRYGAAVFA